jgi:catechol 2,3-dioxygenase-like lactoylglutathione lyase family enzyme
MRLSSLHHVGFSVSDLDRSIEWYSFLLNEEPDLRKVWDVEYVSEVIGYPGARLDIALWRLPGGTVLELLEYLEPRRKFVDMETYNVGNAHLCLVVEDLGAEFRRMQGRGNFRSSKPVDIPWGHFAGGKSCYVRDPDGISIELVELPAAGMTLDI